MRNLDNLNSRPWRIVFGIIFIGLACFKTYPAVQEYRLAKSSEHYGRTTGKIIKQDYNVYVSGRSGATDYKPVIKYKYTVRGKQYIADCIQFSEITFENYKQVSEFISRYQPNTSVVVYYDTENPNLACLKALSSDESAAYIKTKLILFFGFVLVGVFLLSGIGLKKSP